MARSTTWGKSEKKKKHVCKDIVVIYTPNCEGSPNAVSIPVRMTPK